MTQVIEISWVTFMFLFGGYYMKIIGKSAPRDAELRSKIDCTKYIEIHLNEKDIDVQSMFEVITKQSKIDIQYVHSHLFSSRCVKNISSTNLEYLGDFYIKGYLEKAMELAQKLAEFYNHTIGVVVHTGFDYTKYEVMGGLLYGITSAVDELLNIYTNVYLCIENVPYVSGNLSSDLGVIFRSGGFDDNVKLCNYLREALPHNSNRLFTVLDTCHALASVQILRVFNSNIKDEEYMDKLFELNSKTAKLIHMADVKNFGIMKSNHGIVFDDDRKHIMQFFMSCYKKNNLTADITLEIQESDYSISDNFRHNSRMLKEICSDLSLSMDF